MLCCVSNHMNPCSMQDPQTELVPAHILFQTLLMGDLPWIITVRELFQNQYGEKQAEN